jgi:TFIIF-interacting CTD phosphatase-like protein
MRPMKVSTNELLLALRAPNSGWLAALICALDEALQDPDFGTPQRDLVRSLIESGSVPHAVAVAANERLERFEETVRDLHSLLVAPANETVDEAPARPKLTLCGAAG